MRLLVCLLLAFSLAACSRPYGEVYAWGDDWYTSDPAQAEPFFDALEAKLAAEGLIPAAPPLPDLITTSGIQPAGGDRLYWFQGSYRGSPAFQIKLLRSGPHLEGFHLMYSWEMRGFTSPNKDMEARTRELHEELRQWVEAGGVAHLPPGPDSGKR